MGIWMSVSERERRLADTASHIVKVTGFSFVIFTAFSGHLSSTKKKKYRCVTHSDGCDERRNDCVGPPNCVRVCAFVSITTTDAITTIQ